MPFFGGFKLFSLGGSLAMSLVALVGLGGLKFSYDAGVIARDRAKVEARREKLNAVVRGEDQAHRQFLMPLYTQYGINVAALQQPTTPAEQLQQCPADCSNP